MWYLTTMINSHLQYVRVEASGPCVSISFVSRERATEYKSSTELEDALCLLRALFPHVPIMESFE